MRSITVNENTYNSISAAWRAESPDGLPEITVRGRLNAGWSTRMAFGLAPVEPRLRASRRDYFMRHPEARNLSR